MRVVPRDFHLATMTGDGECVAVSGQPKGALIACDGSRFPVTAGAQYSTGADGQAARCGLRSEGRDGGAHGYRIHAGRGVMRQVRQKPTHTMTYWNQQPEHRNYRHQTPPTPRTTASPLKGIGAATSHPVRGPRANAVRCGWRWRGRLRRGLWRIGGSGYRRALVSQFHDGRPLRQLAFELGDAFLGIVLVVHQQMLPPVRRCRRKSPKPAATQRISEAPSHGVVDISALGRRRVLNRHDRVDAAVADLVEGTMPAAPTQIEDQGDRYPHREADPRVPMQAGQNVDACRH